MAPISSAGSFAIPAAQPPRSQAERSAPAAETEKVAQQEKQLQRASDEESRRSSEQVISAGEQQKIEAAQQEAQRAEFDQQAGNVRDTEPNDVRPPSNFEANTSEIDEIVKLEPIKADKPGIETFTQLQNFDSPSRQGQEINQFA